MKTLVKIVKLINGYESWYRIEGQAVPTYEIVFTVRPAMKGGK